MLPHNPFSNKVFCNVNFPLLSAEQSQFPARTVNDKIKNLTLFVACFYKYWLSFAVNIFTNVPIIGVSLTVTLFLLLFSSEGNLSVPNNHTSKSHHDLWNGRSYKKEPIKRSSSLPSVVTQWTCVRCLSENSCSSAVTCVVCDANYSISKTDKKQIGARKSRKLNLRKTNRLKTTSELLANILDGFNATSTSINNARDISKGEYYVNI